MEFDLNEVRRRLDAYDSEIVELMLQRAQMPLNAKIYTFANTDLDGAKSRMIHEHKDILYDEIPTISQVCTFKEYIAAASLLDLSFVAEDDELASEGRFRSYCEMPFSPFIGGSKNKSEDAPEMFKGLERLNFNHDIKEWYVHSAVRDLCVQEDDGRYAEAILLDRQLLRAVSRRIHYAIFNVAEAKFQAKQDKLVPLIEQKQADEIVKLLVHVDREKAVCDGIRDRVIALQDTGNYSRKVDPKMIADFYQKIISITTKGEVNYLMTRNLEL